MNADKAELWKLYHAYFAGRTGAHGQDFCHHGANSSARVTLLSGVGA